MQSKKKEIEKKIKDAAMKKELSKGIGPALVDFAIDKDTGEGVESAFYKIDRWKDALDEMMEVANMFERASISLLRESITNAVNALKGVSVK